MQRTRLNDPDKQSLIPRKPSAATIPETADKFVSGDPDKKKMIKTTIYLPEDEYQALRRRGFDEVKSHNDIIREALKLYLKS